MTHLNFARFALACTAAALAPATVHAQGFPQPEGQGRVIASVIYSHSDKGFDANSDVVDIADYDKLEIYLLGEFGVTDDLTLLATPSFRSVQIEGGDDGTGLGFTDLGARYRLIESGNLNLSAQALVRIPGTKWRNQLAQVGQTDTEVDLRGQAAWSFKQGHFAILETGYRLRSGDPANEFHIDATLGLRATPKLLFLASSYNTVSDGRGRGVFDKHRFHNLYLSGAYEVAPKITLQLGILGTIAGRSALRERGIFGGLWFSF